MSNKERKKLASLLANANKMPQLTEQHSYLTTTSLNNIKIDPVYNLWAYMDGVYYGQGFPANYRNVV